MAQQLVSPNLTVKGTSGWCLSVTQNVWNVPHWYPKAIDSWNAGNGNHPNEYPPDDVCVVLYWSYQSDGVQYGHVATWVPGKGVYTSPFNVMYGSEWYGSVDAMTNRINRIAGANSKYLGWSEVLSGVQLVNMAAQGGSDEMITDSDNEYWRWSNLATFIRGRYDRPSNQFVPLTRDEFRASAVGQTWLRAIEILMDSSEANDNLEDLKTGKVARVDNWPGQIQGLQNQLEQAVKTANDAISSGTATKAELTDALNKIADLKAQLKQAQETPQPEQTPDKAPAEQLGAFNSLVNFLKKLLNIKDK